MMLDVDLLLVPVFHVVACFFQGILTQFAVWCFEMIREIIQMIANDENNNKQNGTGGALLPSTPAFHSFEMVDVFHRFIGNLFALRKMRFASTWLLLKIFK